MQGAAGRLSPYVATCLFQYLSPVYRYCRIGFGIVLYALHARNGLCLNPHCLHGFDRPEDSPAWAHAGTNDNIAARKRPWLSLQFMHERLPYLAAGR